MQEFSEKKKRDTVDADLFLDEDSCCEDCIFISSDMECSKGLKPEWAGDFFDQVLPARTEEWCWCEERKTREAVRDEWAELEGDERRNER